MNIEKLKHRLNFTFFILVELILLGTTAYLFYTSFPLIKTMFKAFFGPVYL